MPRLQPAAARRHAVPITRPSGRGLVKSTISTGWMLERRRVRVPLDADFPQERRKDFLFRAARQFIEEEYRLDRSVYRGGMRVHGPFPHFDPHEPDTQIGDRGGRRLRARSVVRDTTDNGKEDYVLEATFVVPEYISELPTDLALEMFPHQGARPGLRPLRAREWHEHWRNQ